MKTNAPIVITIFGNERCVVSLDDLEAASHAPENEGPNSVINAQSDAALSGSQPAPRDDTGKEANDHA
jgi:hypothetical protein